MSKLKAFLQPSPAGKTKEVIVSKRFKDEEGNPVPFIVKCITPEENETMSKASMDDNGKLDAAVYGNKLIVACTVEPNFKDSETCAYYGVVDPLEVPNQMLSIGEKQILQDAIMDVNDIKDAREKLREAKNS